jgi:hypothetical protein
MVALVADGGDGPAALPGAVSQDMRGRRHQLKRFCRALSERVAYHNAETGFAFSEPRRAGIVVI